MQTLIVTRVIFSLLALPLLIIFGTLIGLLAAFYLYTVNPLLGLLLVLIGGGIVYALVRRELRRTAKEIPPADDL